MVKFFDQKQEVIQIELTPYGRDLLSQGKFSPSYYAFYDTNILYDGSHGDVTETQNQIVDRIKDGTPRSRPQTRFSSQKRSLITAKSANYENYYDQEEEYCGTYNRFLGKNNVFSDFAPSWDVRVVERSDADLGETVTYKANNTIPELTTTLEIKYDEKTIDESTTYTLSENQNLVLDVQEMNTVFSINGNYDLEIFRIGERGKLHQLGFLNPESKAFDVLTDQIDPTVLSNTIEGTDGQILSSFPILDNTYVEYYMEIVVDQDVLGVQMPSNSTLYKRNVDVNPGNICKVIQSTEEHFPI